MPEPSRHGRAEDHPLRGRFYLIILAFLLLMAVSPFMENFRTLRFVTDLSMAMVFLSIVYAVSQHRRNLVIGFLLMLPPVASLVSESWFNAPLFEALASLSGAVFIAFSLCVMGRYISRQKEINQDVIGAAIVFYLLMGLMWSIAFQALEYFEPGSFAMGDDGATDPKMRFIYYSFVTLTTLGYGDITPVTAEARALSIIEAIVGQLYLVIQVAWLVGMHISRTMAQDSGKTDGRD